MTMHRLSDQIYMLAVPFAGVDLFLYLVGGDTLALIDSGINTSPEEYIFPALDTAGWTPDYLINTHGHVDHFGGNAAVQERYPSIKTAIHHQDVIWAEDHERHLHEMYLCMPQTWQFEDGGKEHLEQCGPNSAIDIHLGTDQKLSIGDLDFTVLHAPGHAPGQILLHDTAQALVICGDVALGSGVSLPDGSKMPPYYYDPGAYVASMKRALNLGADLYCTGHHGALNHEKMATLVDESVAMVEQLDRLSLAALSEEPLSLAGVVEFISGKLPGYVIGFHMYASVQAHLLRHCQQARARVLMLDNLKHYSLC